MAAVAKSYTPPSSVAERYPHRQTSLESLSSSSFVDWVNQWGDDDVARWLQENRMTQYAPVFRDNDIRGSVILDVDQQALKEMNISSVGDRVKIVVAIKKLRTACATSRNSMLSHASSNSSLNTSYQASGNNYQVKRQNSAKGTGRVPPPLHLDHYRYQSQTQTTASSSSSSLLSAHPKSSSVGTVSPSATSPAHHIRRASSPRQPPPVPAPKAQLPVPPSSASQDLPRSRTPNTLHMPLGQATRSTKYTQPGNSVPSLNVSKSSTSSSRSHRKTDSNSHPSVRPSTAGPSYTQPLNLSHHPYATNISPTLDNFDLPPSRPGTAPQPTSKTMGLGGAGLPSINEAPPAHTEHARSSSHSDKNGFSVGKGAFARPSTSAGTLSVNSTTGAVVHSSSSNFASVEELMRKTVKFESDEDGATKLVNVENLGGDVVELLRRVLKKFGKLQWNPQLARARDGDLTYTQLDGWAIFAATADGSGRWLADSDLFNICQSIHRTERQRGLLLRCVDRKRTSSKREQSGNSSTSPTSPTYLLDVRLPTTSIEPASPTPSSPGESPRGVTSDTGHDQGKRNTLHRASTVSVMSGLLDWNTVSAQVRPPSLGGALSSGTTRLRNFFGHRPPSELISSHLAEYFPSAEKKLLNKTIRNSVRKSMAVRPKSTASNWDANSSRFSISSAGSSIVGVEPPPPLPAKDHYAAMPLNHENSRWSRIPVNDSSSSFEEEPEADNLPRDSQFASDSLDDESLGVRRTKSRQSQSSRMSSRLSIRTTRSTGRDSDNASLLTVDEITAEVENRRMSMASNWAAPSPAINVADENDVGVRDDMSRSSRSSTSSLQDTLEEEDEEDTEDDEDFEEDDAAPEKVTSTGTKQQIKWIKGALIGAGSFGQVFLAMDAMNGALMAVKQVEIPTGTSHNESRKKSMLDALQREIDLLKGLQHPNIVEYLDSSSDGKHLNIFLEYVPGGSVVALLRNYGSFEEPLVRNFVRQIVFGLNYLHERDIVHRDIKGANILVDNKGLIKISDFGISKRVEDNLLSGVKIHRPSLQGSVFWMAPEVVKQTSYTSKADIWSLGCVTIEMLTGNHPHVNLNQMQALFKIGTASAAPDMPPDVSQECVNFLQATFLQDYSARPSAAELLQSPFMAITADSLNSTLSQKTPTASTFPV